MGGKGTEREIWKLDSDEDTVVVKKVWGSKEEFEALRSQIEKAHNIKLYKRE